jgi:hypothetical protein
MRRFALALTLVIIATPVLAQPQPQSPVQIINGVVTFPWSDGVPETIYCTPGTTCSIRVDGGGEIVDVVCAKSEKNGVRDGWIIDQSAIAAKPMIYVTATPYSPTTNLILRTQSGRAAIAILRAEPSSHYAYAFAAKPTIAPSDPSPSPAGSPAPTATPRTIDRAYRLYGNAPFLPTEVRREGDLTYIVLRDGLYPQPDVAMFRVDDGFRPAGCPGRDHETGRVQPVGYVQDPANPHQLVVTGIYPALIVYSGEGAKQQCVYVFRAEHP